MVRFDRAVFSGGEVRFDRAEFSGGEVRFDHAKFSGGEVSLDRARFADGTVNFSHAAHWAHPPVFSWDGEPPAGVALPVQPPGEPQGKL